ncbi:Pectinesterase 31 [Zea mays]|uniref:pectinesterase n=1 Tax=Zea mays TaxID=4577 RepID=A0A1D6N7W7_MAIZE|nr:Pectinesterase 31 [Zea mays]
MGDRRVLLVASPEVAVLGYDGVVSFASVQDTVDAVPPNNQVRTVIRIGPGVQRQQVCIPRTKNFITLCGSSIKDTLICWNNKTTTCIKHTQVSGQAATVRVTADRCAFYGCRFLDWQKTLHLHGGKQLLKNCYVEGSCDFIFGDSTAFWSIAISTTNQRGILLLMARNPRQNQLDLCSSKTFMDRCIEPARWHNWDKPENEQTVCFYEYRCSSPGSSVSGRTSIDPDIENPWLVHRLGTPVPVSVSSLQ